MAYIESLLVSFDYDALYVANRKLEKSRMCVYILMHEIHVMKTVLGIAYAFWEI